MAFENGCGLCKISVNNIGVKKGGDTLLSDVSFHLHCGELTAVIGVNGAGKTTLFKDLHINEILPTSSSINVFISLFKWLNDNHICIDTDFKCGIIDIQFENLTEYNYYDSLLCRGRIFGRTYRP